jgi:glutamyl-tRNA reductase
MNAPGETRLLVLGWNFRTAADTVRERVAFTAEEIRDGLARLVGRGVVSEGVIVSTCHRSEIYGLADERGAEEALTRFVSEWRGVTEQELAGAGFHRIGEEAARHLFRVAAGLDSMALGESEVLGQVRRALTLAREAGATRSVLHRLFEWAVAAGKRVRAETEIGMHPLSIPAIGFELAGKVFGELSERTVLVLGAGETAGLFARHASEAGVADLRVANRTSERARDLAARVGGRAVAWETLAEQIADADVVVGTTASPAPVVRRADVEAAMRQRRGRPIFFLDLAVPRDIEEEVADVYNVFRHGVNDLEEVAVENRRRRAREIPQAETILEEELGKFLVWFGNLSIVPTVTDLRRRFELARDAELARAPESDRDRLRAFADALSGRLLHEPLRRLKAEDDPGRKLDRADAIRHLFDLDGVDRKSGKD